MHGESGLHRAGDWPAIVAKTRAVAELTAAVGGRHLVFVPVPGLPRRRHRRLPGAGRARPATSGRTMVRAADELGRIVAEEYGVRAAVPPARGQPRGDPGADRAVPGRHRPAVRHPVPGHRAPGVPARRTASQLIRRYPDRIGYVHIKQMDPAIVARAERGGPGLRPGGGAGRELRAAAGPARTCPSVVAALSELGRRRCSSWSSRTCTRCDFDVPAPIAARTRRLPARPSASAADGRLA